MVQKDGRQIEHETETHDRHAYTVYRTKYGETSHEI